MSEFSNLFEIFKKLLNYFLGDYNGIFCALAAFTAADLIIGILAAGVNHELSAALCIRNLIKKVCIFILVGTAHILEANVMQEEEILRTAVMLYFISKEGIDVCRNADRIGVEIPGCLKSVLLGMGREVKTEEGEDEEGSGSS